MPFILSNWRLIVEAVLIAICFLFFGLWQHSSAKLAQVKAAGEYAEQEAKRINDLHEKTFKETQDAFAKAIPTIRANAVDTYRKRFPQRVCNSSKVPVPGNAEGAKTIDDPKQQSLVTDESFIRACAQDALTVQAWQDWARGNQLLSE